MSKNRLKKVVIVLGIMHKLRNLLGGYPPYRNDYVTVTVGGVTPKVTLNKTRLKIFTVVVTGGSPPILP